MDDVLHFPEVQRSERDSDDFRDRPEQPVLLTVEDLSLLTLRDIEQAKDIVDKYAQLTIPREATELFKQHLFQRVDSWFVQVADVGLIYLTNIVPAFTANLQVMFWDKKFGKLRRELVQRVIATGIHEFALTRVQAFVPETNIPLAQVELRKIGFHHEGTLRKAWRDNADCDLLVFGLLKEEVKEWQAVHHLVTTSSAVRT